MFDVILESCKSPLVAFFGGTLLGIFIGAAGNYYAAKFTDQRNKQEKNSEIRDRFNKCKSHMPELFAEMSQDLLTNPIKSEFVLLNIKYCYSGFPEQPLLYYMNDERSNDNYTDENKNLMVHSNLLDKIKMLENNGLVFDVTETDVPYFRMTDEFKQMLKSL